MYNNCLFSEMSRMVWFSILGILMVSLKKGMLLCMGTRHEAQAGHQKAQRDLETATLCQAAMENSMCGPESKKSHFTQLALSWHFPGWQWLGEAEDYFSWTFTSKCPHQVGPARVKKNVTSAPSGWEPQARLGQDEIPARMASGWSQAVPVMASRWHCCSFKLWLSAAFFPLLNLTLSWTVLSSAVRGFKQGFDAVWCWRSQVRSTLFFFFSKKIIQCFFQSQLTLRANEMGRAKVTV